jgi:hypothetical protein
MFIYFQGTKDAFVQATEIFHNLPALSDNRVQTSGGRITALYSYFGYKTGNYVPAYDVISNSRRVSKTSKYTTNLKVLILTEVGRLKDAFLIIRSECLPSRDVTARQSRSNSKNDQVTCFRNYRNYLTLSFDELHKSLIL